MKHQGSESLIARWSPGGAEAKLNGPVSEQILQSNYGGGVKCPSVLSNIDRRRCARPNNRLPISDDWFRLVAVLNIIIDIIFSINYISIQVESALVSIADDTHALAQQPILSSEDFTFAHNGSFIQIDACRDWPFNSKREISFRFRTKSPHGLLIYQTFDHNKLQREDDLYNADDTIPSAPLAKSSLVMQSVGSQLAALSNRHHIATDDSIFSGSRMLLDRRRRRRSNNEQTTTNMDRGGDMKKELDNDRIDMLSDQYHQASTITATASEKLVNSLFSSSPRAAINGNNRAVLSSSQQTKTNRLAILDKSPLLLSADRQAVFNSRNIKSNSRNRLLTNMASINSDPPNSDYETRIDSRGDSSGASTVLSSSTMSSLSGSLYELYLKLENGRLKLMYEFGSRLNQTYCGKGLNDDRWHRVELKVDPEINQMLLILDQSITVEIALTSQISSQEDDPSRRNELVFTNSVLYLGGLNNNASIVRNVRQRLYLAQFIGCIGQIMLKTDQHTELSLQPVAIDKMMLVKRGCIDRCEVHNYCLHKSTCLNYYSHTICDCFGTSFEDTYCWQDQLTTLTMVGHSTLAYRIYDWRDRHHSSNNRFSMQFKTLASDSILFFAFGDLSGPQVVRNQPSTQSQPTISNIYNTATMLNISYQQAIPRSSPFQYQGNNNYLALSLSNGSLVAEVNFGDQQILLSNILNEKINIQSQKDSRDRNLSDWRQPVFSDGEWHNVTFVHNNKLVYLHLDEYSINYTLSYKNNHLYFDPSIYIGSVPNFLSNETRALKKPFNLRYKYIGCLRSIYFNQHNILLNLKKGSTAVDYRDILGKPQLDRCLTQNPNSLPLTIRSGKSYLTFQFSQNHISTTTASSKLESSSDSLAKSKSEAPTNITTRPEMTVSHSIASFKKITRIQFEYKTSLRTYFLAGGHLRDLSYHDLGGFWTLHASEDCLLYFTVSSGLTYDPEQILKLNVKNKSCQPDLWYRVSISLLSGDKILNITRSQVISYYDDEEILSLDRTDHGTYNLESSVELLHQVQLGGDLSKFGESVSIPFSGCLRHIVINGYSFDSRDFVISPPTAALPPPPLAGQSIPINQNSTTTLSGPTLQPQHDIISSRVAQGYVTLDSCRLVNPCLTLNPCKNSGLCKINEFGEPDCDCTKTGYTGRRCQFSIYKRSCQDLYLSGQRRSSYYLIDTDRNGPLKPIRVRCNMEDGGNNVETSISHNLPAEYFIRRSATNDVVLDITYLAFHHIYTHDGFYVQDDEDESTRLEQDSMLRSLIGQSAFCKQYFRYECRSAPLKLGNKTWMEVPYPKRHRLVSLDGSMANKCYCASKDKKCLNPDHNCNCDAGEPIWSDDSTELTLHDQVGVTRIVLLRQDDEGKDGDGEEKTAEPLSRFTLSDLRCYGSRHHGSEHEITFKTSDAYIEVPGWQRGDISFQFRTASSPPAIVLYQLATSRNHGYFRLTLVGDTRLLFEFIVNRRPRKLTLITSHKLNNGDWQQVYIEYDSANLRIVVNDDSALVDFDPNDYLGTFEGPLFIGGAPSKYLVGDPSKRNGFTGCFRGLRIDNYPIDLNSYLSPSMPTVISGCQPSCTENLCQNGGKCIEYWGSYECECSNPIAHSGNNCEINLNTNSITFVTPESHYVQPSNESLPYPAYLTKNILLNIRTYQETALVLYASDRYYNFMQLHKNGSSMVLTFNSNLTIVTAHLPIRDETSSRFAASNHATVISAPTNTTPNEPTPTSNLSQNSTTTTIDNSQLSTASTTTNSSHNVLQQKTQQTPITTQKHLETEGSIKASNTSGSGQPIQIKIERHRLRTTFYVNNNFVVIEKPIVFLNNFTQNLWLNPEFELVRPAKPRAATQVKVSSRIFLAGVDEHFTTRLPGFTGCIQGFSIDNQLYDFNRAHLLGEFRGDYRIGCKMRCDSFPCKNQGTCIENWMEDKIECKCETTSYVGKLCDEDIAAIFNGHTSYFIYDLSEKLKAVEISMESARLLLGESSNVGLDDGTYIRQNVTTLMEMEQPIPKHINLHLEITLAFSSEANQSTLAEKESSTVQVLVFMTQANSSQHFLLGLTSDGGLLVQEDYGNSMSLSRLIKKSDHSYSDGYRHIFRYSRHNQTIQIQVDHQAYLPTMSVISGNHANMSSNKSLIFVGTARDQLPAIPKLNLTVDFGGPEKSRFINYVGCISNLLVKTEGISVEPLSEAFGQNLETINVNATTSKNTDTLGNESPTDIGIVSKSSLANIATNNEFRELSDDYTTTDLFRPNRLTTNAKLLSSMSKISDREVSDNMETIVAKDVEQGNCATFKKSENTNEKRSINSSKNTPLLEPKPVYTDPPRIKTYKHSRSIQEKNKPILLKIGTLFYSAIAFIVIVGSSTLVYAYILQIRYKSEKFRCETPFFNNKRDDDSLD